ncbi:propanol-preferring alcohol dehydrogenase [Sediminihabitans luteus]|uniref:Alcohol dehydrogenase n=1 Tax=Sediminihabitans luteus TaxID=1138585 RepID=A0A2M9CCJ4_9CELL|nr:alcohol dehydrogenase AdhP [Sediminihabitans luteus]PJJ69102.1 propanol-preferring alcohol dehydrogenase [Sediminihabitans luteus]GII99488.1 zinc-dependent alcohol dehydrogenase [Sediminihabitans luteus]
MSTMRAAVVTSFTEPLDVTETSIPTPGPNEALVKVEYTGVCHTDLHAAHGDWPVKPTAPFIPGHEGVGTVVAVGEGVTRVKVGDTVGNAWLASACGECEYCETGWETLCPNQQNGGYSVDGSFGQYMVVDSRYCPIIPDGVELSAVGPILCAGVTVYKGLKQTDTKPGEWVLISGIGGLGHIAVQYAVAMGRRVAAVDVDDAKLELARKHGAEVTVNAATSPDAAAEIQAATGGGVHGALVTAVNAHAFPQAVGSLRRGGTVSLVGLPPEQFPLDIFTTVLFGLTVRGSIVGTRKDMTEALDFFARGLVTPTYTVRPLDDINEIFGEMEKGAIDGRVVMQMQ